MKLKINLKKKGHNTKDGGDLKKTKKGHNKLKNNKLNNNKLKNNKLKALKRQIDKINEVIKTTIFFFEPFNKIFFF